MSLITLNQIYKRMIMQLSILLNRARLLVQSPVALTKPASTSYLYRVLLLWQSLQVWVTCTESCCSDKACMYRFVSSVVVTMNKVCDDGFMSFLIYLNKLYMYVYDALVSCHSDGYGAIWAWSVYWYLWDVMELHQSGCNGHNLLWFIAGLGNCC